MVNQGDLLLNARDVSRILGISVWTVRTMLNEGSLPGIKVGSKWKVARSVIDDIMKEARDGCQQQEKI